MDIDADEVTTKKAVLDKVREDATIFLSDEFIEEHNVLVKASEYLNKLKNPNSSNFLIRNYLGKYTINLQSLNNSNRM